MLPHKSADCHVMKGQCLVTEKRQRQMVISSQSRSKQRVLDRSIVLLDRSVDRTETHEKLDGIRSIDVVARGEILNI